MNVHMLTAIQADVFEASERAHADGHARETREASGRAHADGHASVSP